MLCISHLFRWGLFFLLLFKCYYALCALSTAHGVVWLMWYVCLCLLDSHTP